MEALSRQVAMQTLDLASVLIASCGKAVWPLLIPLIVVGLFIRSVILWDLGSNRNGITQDKNPVSVSFSSFFDWQVCSCRWGWWNEINHKLMCSIFFI